MRTCRATCFTLCVLIFYQKVADVDLCLVGEHVFNDGSTIVVNRASADGGCSSFQMDEDVQASFICLMLKAISRGDRPPYSTCSIRCWWILLWGEYGGASWKRWWRSFEIVMIEIIEHIEIDLNASAKGRSNSDLFDH